MIIGNNKNNNFNTNPTGFQSNFEQRFNTIKEEWMKNHNQINPFKEDTIAKQYNDPTNKHEMADKSFAMLQERYNNGLISLDEFNKKCRELSILRQK